MPSSPAFCFPANRFARADVFHGYDRACSVFGVIRSYLGRCLTVGHIWSTRFARAYLFHGCARACIVCGVAMVDVVRRLPPGYL
eukprot:7720749-Pyramimonas_sp.AAC.1